MRISRWDELGEPHETEDIITRLAHWHLRHITDAESILRDRLGRLLGDRDYHGLCTFDLPVVKTAADQYHLSQVIGFFKKRRDLDIGIDTLAVATKEFYRCEAECWTTNRLFSGRARGELTFSPRVEAVLHRARQKIAQILGAVPTFSDLQIRFGPGATTDLPRRRASVQNKLNMPLSCSEDLYSILPRVLAEMPAWVQIQGSPSAWLPTLIKSAKASFVRKNAKTDRGIAVESQLNIMFQLGVGEHIARQLRREGVDIRDQTRNQKLALLGSQHGALATLDLSSASDLVSYGLVLDLLPIDWVDLLDSLRSSTEWVEGRLMRLAKFSSMGNGFTFPLETLIFYALAWACQDIHCIGDSAVSVYGDDIIVPTRSVALVTETLQVVGFRVNMSKSFWSGPFRESCGKDYHSGIDVRPFILKDGLSGMLLFILHNYYVRNGMPEPASLVLSEIPKSLRIWGPDGYGDGHLVGNWEPMPYRRKRGWGGCTFDTYSLCGITEVVKRLSDCVLPGYSIYARPPEAGLADIQPSDIQKMEALYGRRSCHHGDTGDSWSPDYPTLRMDIPSLSEDDAPKASRPPYTATLPGWDGYTRKTIYVLHS